MFSPKFRKEHPVACGLLDRLVKLAVTVVIVMVVRSYIAHHVPRHAHRGPTRTGPNPVATIEFVRWTPESIKKRDEEIAQRNREFIAAQGATGGDLTEDPTLGELNIKNVLMIGLGPLASFLWAKAAKWVYLLLGGLILWECFHWIKRKHPKTLESLGKVSPRTKLVLLALALLATLLVLAWLAGILGKLAVIGAGLMLAKVISNGIMSRRTP